MHAMELKITSLIHENFSIILTYAFSQVPLSQLREEKFLGEWKYWDKMCFEVSRIRANRAALELATHLRVLDEEEKIGEYLKTIKHEGLGDLEKKNGQVEKLDFRKVTNKIMHSKGFDWDFSDLKNPKLICMPTDEDQWIKAEISILALGRVCGMLMS